MVKKISVLEEVEKKVLVEVGEKHDPKEYFKDGKGLYVFSSFVERIVEKAEPTAAGTKLGVASYKLTKYSTDEQIETDLPKEHIFSESEVCAVIAGLIAKQSKGEEGVLLNNGNFNLFYTPAFVVGVFWYGGEWYVYAWDRDGHEWHGGLQVFSPVN